MESADYVLSEMDADGTARDLPDPSSSAYASFASGIGGDGRDAGSTRQDALTRLGAYDDEHGAGAYGTRRPDALFSTRSLLVAALLLAVDAGVIGVSAWRLATQGYNPDHDITGGSSFRHSMTPVLVLACVRLALFVPLSRWAVKGSRSLLPVVVELLSLMLLATKAAWLYKDTSGEVELTNRHGPFFTWCVLARVAAGALCTRRPLGLCPLAHTDLPHATDAARLVRLPGGV